MKKKLVAGAVTLLSVLTLAACTNGTNKDVVTMKGDTITVSDFYDEIKTNQGAQQVLFQTFFIFLPVRTFFCFLIQFNDIVASRIDLTC